MLTGTKCGSFQQIQEVSGLLMRAGEGGGECSARVMGWSAPRQFFVKCFQPTSVRTKHPGIIAPGLDGAVIVCANDLGP